MFERVLGDNYGVQHEDGPDGRLRVVKPELFANSFVYNPKNFYYLKASVKSRRNRVGAQHSSAALLENAMGDDKVLCVKAGTRLALLNVEEPLMSNLVFKSSAELVNGEQTSLIKAKGFARLTRKFGAAPFYGQLALDSGFIKRLGGHQGDIRVNDAFYLSNFKGIRNLGYYFDPNAKKKGLGGDILGFDRYAVLSGKLAQIDCPLLQDFSMEPFVFFNAALAPSREARPAGLPAWRHHLRWALGFGLSLQPTNCAIECYYSVHVSR